ncbi:MAG: hypothetical protein D6696_21710 [Acidobacteria bacterium]|nr:MAG: hypothetical protein D6696_21710 [Acidobacteriota bacterium]
MDDRTWNDDACRACLRWGWTAVACFLLLGLGLELLHLIKAPFYLEVHLRRELWTLAHAHGTLLGLVTVAYGLSARRLVASAAGRRRGAWLMRAGLVLVPGGFLLGGVGNAEGDPSLAIVLVPVGALLALSATATLAAGAWRRRPRPAAATPPATPGHASPSKKKARRR